MKAQAATLSAGLIGLGRMGIRHLQVLGDLSINVVGLADRSEEALAAAKAEAPASNAATFTDGLRMLEEARPEIVVIATTAPAHAPMVLAAVDAGARYILCEKPIATSIAEAEDMIEKCRAAGVKLAINHQMQFMPQYTEVKRLIGSDEFGPLASIVFSGSNFGLAMNGSHYFEMFRYVGDSPVEAVAAWLDEDLVPNPRGPEFEDRSGRILTHNANGRTLYLDIAGDAGWGMNMTYICRNGQIQVDELSGEMRIAHREAQYRELPTTRYGMPVERRIETIPPADSVAPTRAVLEALLAGDDYPSGEIGLAALRCLVAAYLSHERGGGTVTIAETEAARDRCFAWA